MHKILLFLSALAMVAMLACDPGKKLQRICLRHPEACRQDTVTTMVYDTLTIQQFGIDTTFNIDDYMLHDTVYLVKNNVVVKYLYNPTTKKVFLGMAAGTMHHVFEHHLLIINREVTFKKHWTDYLALAITIITGIFFIRAIFLKRDPPKP